MYSLFIVYRRSEFYCWSYLLTNISFHNLRFGYECIPKGVHELRREHHYVNVIRHIKASNDVASYSCVGLYFNLCLWFELYGLSYVWLPKAIDTFYIFNACPIYISQTWKELTILTICLCRAELIPLWAYSTVGVSPLGQWSLGAYNAFSHF